MLTLQRCFAALVTISDGLEPASVWKGISTDAPPCWNPTHHGSGRTRTGPVRSRLSPGLQITELLSPRAGQPQPAASWAAPAWQTPHPPQTSAGWCQQNPTSCIADQDKHKDGVSANLACGKRASVPNGAYTTAITMSTAACTFESWLPCDRTRSITWLFMPWTTCVQS